MRVFVRNTPVTLKPAQLIGKGGEADVYDIGGGLALKLFKPPQHPDLLGFPDQQQAAAARLAEHQRKLRDFPTNIPPRVVVPLDLALDSPRGAIVGYTMKLLQGAEVLLRYGEPAFRQRGVAATEIVSIFEDLHATLGALHAGGVVIGDFNDLNVLVSGVQAYLIDADSFQFGPYLTAMYTDRFADPLLCAPNESCLQLCRPHTASSDWYAYTVMLFRSLLLTDPYGGVFKPKDPVRRIAQAARPLHRITIFDGDVMYPKPARRPEILSDDLLDHFRSVFCKDLRTVFPLKLIHALNWSVCSSCGCEHARRSCPQCRTAVPAPTPQFVRISGKVTAKEVFRTAGLIVGVVSWKGGLRWLVHDGKQFIRECGGTVFSGKLERDMRFGLASKATFVARAGRLVKFEQNAAPEINSVDSCGGQAQFACEPPQPHWLNGGRLVFKSTLGIESIGEVLQNQTRFWLGESLGFGYYRAADYTTGFVFRPAKSGINDAVRLPPMPGQWIRTTCQLSDARCWFVVQRSHLGQLRMNLVVVEPDGSVAAGCDYEEHQTKWLSGLAGALAIGNALLVPTDEGLVRLEVARGQIMETRAFPDTAQFVDSEVKLLPATDGLYVARAHTITHIQMS